MSHLLEGVWANIQHCENSSEYSNEKEEEESLNNHL